MTDRKKPGADCCAATTAQLHSIALHLHWLAQWLQSNEAPGDDVVALDDATGPPPPPPPPPTPELGGN